MTAEDEQLEVSRVIKARRAKVFAAWTDPSLIVQWWGAGDIRCTAAEMNLAVDGAYRIANQAPDGTTMWITGTFSRVEPPDRLTYTWAMEPVDPDARLSIVDVSFRDAPDGTLVTIRQTRIPSTEARTMHLDGWIGCLDGLDRLLGG